MFRCSKDFTICPWPFFSHSMMVCLQQVFLLLGGCGWENFMQIVNCELCIADCWGRELRKSELELSKNPFKQKSMENIGTKKTDLRISVAFLLLRFFCSLPPKKCHKKNTSGGQDAGAARESKEGYCQRHKEKPFLVFFLRGKRPKPPRFPTKKIPSLKL